MNNEKNESIASWLFVFVVCVIGSAVGGWLIIDDGYENLAKTLFLWIPITVIFIAKIAESSVLKRFFHLDPLGQWAIRKDAPNIIKWFFKIMPVMAMLLVGYGFAHLAKFGTI